MLRCPLYIDAPAVAFHQELCLGRGRIIPHTLSIFVV
eukprot:XP_001710152.1 Hypothetical protein GL50803_38441 [Giardia lamblia ATCC 50803]